MGFLKNFFTDVYANETKARPATGFQQLSEVELEAHLNVCRYGDFELTDAVRPSYTLEVVPSAGYRHDTYRDEENRADCHECRQVKVIRGLAELVRDQ